MPARTEISPAKLPLKDQDLFEKTAKILNKNIKFKWKGEQTWAGLSKKDLTELTLQIAAFIGITRKQAKKITVIFGDHYKFPHNDSPPSAICQPFEENGVYTETEAVLNRSLEVFLESMKQTINEMEDERAYLEDLGLYDPKSDPDDHKCEVTPFESVAWSIAEELLHARYYLIAGSISRSTAWSERYLQMLIRKGIKLNDAYDTEFVEVAANRVVLRILTYLATDENRKVYFRQCYLESLESRRVFFATFEEAAYTRTGYKAPTKLILENHSL